MAKNIELVRPHPPEIDFLSVQKRAFQAGVTLKDNYKYGFISIRHEASYVRPASWERDKYLPAVLRAHQVREVLTDHRFRKLTPEMSYEVIGTMLSMLGANIKKDKERLDAMVEVTESLDWYFLKMPFVLNMVREHFRDNWKWNNLPQPADFREALMQASAKVNLIISYCYDLCEYVRRCDAVILQWDPDHWYAPYKGKPELCHHMLEQHLKWGCDSEDAEVQDWFYDQVLDWRNALRLPPPKSEIREISDLTRWPK